MIISLLMFMIYLVGYLTVGFASFLITRFIIKALPGYHDADMSNWEWPTLYCLFSILWIIIDPIIIVCVILWLFYRGFVEKVVNAIEKADY